MQRPTGRPPRVSVNEPAILITANGAEQPVIIIDISAEGFRLKGHAGLTAGDYVYLRFANEGNVPAEVKWVTEEQAGGVLFGSPTI